jgi:CRISPR/Cas system-associated exonuclease Cas4 (RecB family)
VQIKQNDEAKSRLIRTAQAAREEAYPRIAPNEVHVSDLIYCLRKSWYRRQVIRGAGLDEDTALLFMMGQGFHLVLQALGDSEIPIEFDGIHGTVDLIECEGELAVPCEIKSTKYSSRKPISELNHYFEQLAAYVAGWGVMIGERLTRGRLYSVHMNGDYRENRGYTLVARDVDFDPFELEQWRGELQVRKAGLLGKRPPPIEGVNHSTWECGHCEFNKSNGGPCEAAPGRPMGFFDDTTFPSWGS